MNNWIALFALACSLGAVFPAGAMVGPLVGPTQTISSSTDRYCGWPTLARTGENELSVVFSGNREGHVCPWGQVRRVRSTDGGRTWSASETIANGPLDDRDAGILRLADGSLLISWFTSTAFHDYWVKGTVKKNGELFRNFRPNYEEHYAKLDPARIPDELGSFCVRSTDGGKTWSEKVRMPDYTPHGAIQLKDGRLMFVSNERRVCVSSDSGATWSVLARMPPPPKETRDGWKLSICEPALLEGADGVLRCYGRGYRNALYSESRDGGRTWSVPAYTGIASWGSPLQALRLADGRFLLSAARREAEPSCVFALVGDADGLPDSFARAKEIVLYETTGMDFGYATTAQNADGSLVTAFYAHPDGDPVARVMATRWTLPDAERPCIKDGDALAFFGDSITYLGCQKPDGFCNLVVNALKAEGVGVRMIPCGYSGQTSASLLPVLDRKVLRQKPRWMTLACGVNDVLHQDGGKGVPLESYKENIRTILDRCAASNCTAILLTTVVFERGGLEKDPHNVRIAAYNDFLREEAKRRGLPLADVNAAMWAAHRRNPAAEYTVDGIHMAPAGDRLIARCVIAAMGVPETRIAEGRSFDPK